MVHSSDKKLDPLLRERLAKAFSIHEKGEINHAIHLYQGILKDFPNEPETLHRMGMAFFAKGDYENAVNLIEAARAQKPNDGSCYNNLGVSYSALGNNEKAETCFKKALQFDSDNAKAHFNLGRFLVGLEKNEEAIPYYKKALLLEDGYFEARYNLLSLLIRGENPDLEEIQGLLDAGLVLFPNDLDLQALEALLLLQKGVWKEARKCLLNAENKAKKKKGRGYLQFAIHYISEGKLELSADYLRRAVEASSEHGVSFLGLAKEYEKQDKPDDVLTCYKAAADALGTRLDLQFLYGKHLEERGLYVQAEDVYCAALEHHPENITLLLLLARCLLSQKKSQAAYDAATALLVRDQKIMPAYLIQGIALRELGRFNEAIKAFEATEKAEGNKFEVLKQIAECYHQKQDGKKALSYITQAIQADPKNINGYHNFVTFCCEYEIYDGALDILKKGKKLINKDPLLEVLIGRIYFRTGDHKKAESQYKKALSINAECFFAMTELGALYRYTNRSEEAIEILQKAESLECDKTPEELESISMSLSFLNLSMGAFDQAWKRYQDRPTVPREAIPTQKKDLPKDLSNKNILLVMDQGIGDEIFFLRFVPILKERGAAEITYLSSEKIEPLAKRIPFLSHAFSKKNIQKGRRDYSISLGDLPFLLDIATVDKITPSLSLTPLDVQRKKIEKLLRKFGEPPYIGVTWRGGSKDIKRALFKETPIEMMAQTLRNMTGTVISLQRLPEKGELDFFQKKLGRPVHNLVDMNEDLEEMLALLDVLDAYVTVSNTNVHLRETLGKTSHVLIPNPPDFRWMREGKTSPWFIHSRIFRQAVDSDWTAAYQDLEQDLTTFLFEKKEDR
ncbi:MAG: tetratricopeptide repeat protein [Alphaproteobacteria bacterium]